MPTVELLRPRSLNTKGFIFRQGEPRDDVPSEIAVLLVEDNRFKVTGLTREDFESVTAKPADRSNLLADIAEAASRLDEDNEDDFTASGKPHHLAISRVLGYSITAVERDQALEFAKSRGALDSVETATAKATEAPRSGVRIVRGSTSQKEKKDAALAKLNKVGAEKPVEVEKEPEKAIEDAGGEANDTPEEAMEI